MYHDAESVIAAVMENPSAPALLARLQTKLAEELQRRHQFYAEIDDAQKAEFINGEVVIHSPVKIEHSEISSFLMRLIHPFVQINKLGFVGIEKIMISLITTMK